GHMGEAVRISDTNRCIAQEHGDPRDASTVSESHAFDRKSFISSRDTAARLEQDPPVLIVTLHMCRRSVDIRKYCTETVYRCGNIRSRNEKRYFQHIALRRCCEYPLLRECLEFVCVRGVDIAEPGRNATGRTCAHV